MNFHRAWMAAVVLSLAACGGDKVTSPEGRVARLEISPASAQLVIPSTPSVRLTLRALDQSGALVSGVSATWRSSNSTVVSLSSGDDFAVVDAIAAGSATITAAVGRLEASVPIEVSLAPVARVEVFVQPLILGLAETRTATFLVFDASNTQLTGRAVQWQSSAPTVASVSPSGTVTGLAAGDATIIATVEGVSGSALVRVVSTPPNLTVENVYLTQAIQRVDGGVPLVAGGHRVLVNVFGTLDRPFASGALPNVRITVLRGSTTVHVDERRVTGVPATSSSASSPFHQVVLPATIAEPGLRILVAVNPDGNPAEATLSDNVWPASGQPKDIVVRVVPPLPLHFVPIFLSNGGSTGSVNASNMPEYLAATRQMHPVATITETIGPVFSSDVAFGDGQSATWQAILQQLDVLRVAEGTTRYYVGALRPPPGVTFVQYGGFAYIPFDPQSSGPSTRTAVIVGVGWFNRARQSTELVAHELGHTMGRRHAPCGGAAGPDPGYPHSAGAIGAYGHDLETWLQGSTVPPVMYTPSGASDVMSYCTPAWISDYTYEALLQVRSVAAGQPATVPGTPCECLLVWGSVEGDSVRLQPSFVLRTRVSLPARKGPISLVGESASGRPLFALEFEGTELDHAPGVRHFAFAIPLNSVDRQQLRILRVVYRGRSTMQRPIADEAGAATGGASVAVRRMNREAVEVRWNRASTPAVLVRDAATERVLGIGTSGRLVIPTSRSAFDIHLSDGVRSVVSRVQPKQ